MFSSTFLPTSSPEPFITLFQWNEQWSNGFVDFIILWLIFYISNMLELEKEKQVVSAHANDANKLIAWLNFFIETVIGPVLDRLSCQMNSSNAP